MAAIRTEALTRSFPGVTAVDGLTFEVAEGEIFGLVGPDGAGKTTTMRLLTSVMEPTTGDAWVDGLHVVRDAEASRNRIGYMSQRFGLYVDLTVLENIHFYADIYGVPKRGREEKIERLLSFSNLTPFKRRLAGNLSGGMKQKLGLACALIHTPRVLFLDEPTNGVDPVSRRDFWRILHRLNRDGVTIFVSTAYLDEAERCHRVGLLHRGNLLAEGTPAQVKKLLPGSLIEIRSASARQAAALLKTRFDSDRVALHGDRVRLLAGHAEIAIRRATAALEEAGLGPVSARPVEPTLEDVFVGVLARGPEEDADVRA